MHINKDIENTFTITCTNQFLTTMRLYHHMHKSMHITTMWGSIIHETIFKKKSSAYLHLAILKQEIPSCINAISFVNYLIALSIEKCNNFWGIRRFSSQKKQSMSKDLNLLLLSIPICRSEYFHPTFDPHNNPSHSMEAAYARESHLQSKA